MCKHISEALKTIRQVPGSKKKNDSEAMLLFDAVGNDLGDIDSRMKNMDSRMSVIEEKVVKIEMDMSSVKDKQSSMDTKLDLILDKLTLSSIEEKAVVGGLIERMLKSKTTYFVLAIIVGLCIMTGLGVITVFNNSDKIAEITQSVK